MHPRLYVSVLLLACAAVALRATADKAKPPADAVADRSASAWRSVTIWSPPDAPPPDVAYLVRRLTAPDTLDALAEALGIPPEFRQSYRPSTNGLTWGRDEHTATLEIRLDLPRDDPNVPKKAAPFLDALVAQFRQWVAEPDRQAEADAEKRVAIARDEAEAAAERLAQLRAKLRDETGRADVSPEGLRATTASLEQERQRRELQLAASKARHRALQEAAEKSTKRAQGRLDEDEITKQLQKAVDLREARLKRVHQLAAQGAISGEEVTQAEAEVAAAKTAVLQRREAVAGGAGDGALDKVVQQMEAEALNVVEAEAVLRHVLEDLKRLTQAAGRLDEYERLLADRDRAREFEAAARARLEAVRRGGRQPAVVVTRVEDRAAPAAAGKDEGAGKNP